MTRGTKIVGAAIGALVGLACPSDSFDCEGDHTCQNSDGDGVCTDLGYCAFPDDVCPSGLQYGEAAPAHLAGQCVPAQGTTGGSDTASATTSGTSGGGGGATTGMPTTSGPSTTTVSLDESSGAPGSSGETTAGGAESSGSTGATASGFTAYNDLAWVAGQLSDNITTVTSPVGGSLEPSTGALVDYETGDPTEVVLTVTGGSFDGTANGTQGTEPGPGTDAGAVFGGVLSSTGVVTYIDDVDDALVLRLDGMDAAATYEIVLHAHRNDYGWERASLVTLAGADAFANESTEGVDDLDAPLFDGVDDASTRLPADNDEGYVARFVDVMAGDDGQVTLTITFDGAMGSAYLGKYASALMVRETPMR
ncbi:MAG: hypothetical protein AAF721_30460 [Myxococcota bacterium]